jgi:NSS family neurotransmitter:Na+ symporter
MTAAPQWNTRAGFILASAGSAVGLGAIWKFPYWAGINGGAAFIIPYLFFTFTFGIALVMAETAVGRRGRGSAVSAMKALGGRAFGAAGALGVLASFVILSYYSVVGGWCLAYLWNALRGALTIPDTEILRDNFSSLVTDGTANAGWHFAFLTITAAIAALGVRAGIERLARVLMPLLFVLMAALIVRSLTLPGAADGVRFLFQFDPSLITGSAVLNALGFTFFSLSLGIGVLVTYGAYLKPGAADIRASSFWICLLSTLASLMAGLMTMPAVFAFGLEPNAGPGLTFITLPLIFAQLPFSALLACCFYLCLLVAAITSAISLLEVVAAFLVNDCGLRRTAAVALCWGLAFALGCASALSFGPWADFTLAGRSIFDVLDFVCTNFLMPLGGLAVALLAGFKAWPQVAEELSTPRPFRRGEAALLRFSIAVLAPLLIVVTFVRDLI